MKNILIFVLLIAIVALGFKLFIGTSLNGTSDNTQVVGVKLSSDRTQIIDTKNGTVLLSIDVVQKYAKDFVGNKNVAAPQDGGIHYNGNACFGDALLSPNGKEFVFATSCSPGTLALSVTGVFNLETKQIRFLQPYAGQLIRWSNDTELTFLKVGEGSGLTEGLITISALSGDILSTTKLFTQ